MAEIEVVSGPYLKKMNRNDDIASWEAWEFFIRSQEHSDAVEDLSFMEFLRAF